MDSKYKKIFLSTIYTIIIGSLGSALWETVLKPLLNLAPSIILNFFGMISNSLYRQIPLSGHTLADITARYFLLFFFLAIISGPKKLSTILQKMSDNTSKYLIYPFFLIATYIIITHMICDITARSVLRDISIVAPYVSDQEYKQLQSDFYSIASKSDYDKLHFNIEKIMEENNLSK